MTQKLMHQHVLAALEAPGLHRLRSRTLRKSFFYRERRCIEGAGQLADRRKSKCITAFLSVSGAFSGPSNPPVLLDLYIIVPQAKAVTAPLCAGLPR